MILFLLVAMPLLVWWGWKSGYPMRRRRYALAYAGIVLSMAFLKWATAPDPYSYVKLPEGPNSEQRGANMICSILVLYGCPKLGRRFKDTRINEGWVVVMAVLSPIGLPWIVALFYPPSKKRGLNDPAK